MKKYLLGLLTALSLYGSTHIVILGDPHLPGKNPQMKEHVLEQINQWNDVNMVVAMGDLCSRTGTEEEYAYVKAYFSKLTKPLYVITGNHDFIYADELGSNEKLQHAPREIQEAKLKRFQTTFNLPNLYYSIEKENYLLLFLSADNPSHLAELSKEQLTWIEHELQKHPKMPTIVFFHAPLDNTLETYNRWVNTPNFVAQPKEKIQKLIQSNPQLFLWISGHTHTSVKEPSFASTINHYEHVTNIHNSDMNKEVIWTNSLFLYDNHVTIKTYNHTEEKWLDPLERTISVPRF
ncbi:metallophosphoesterase family protein [Sulfurospirillum arsenophilum]|uniref:metallophosphoesterase family protein n=1 Tax=Sulfurospirillum arsenophilum TaxID=56698 RepID=UPI0005A8E2AF|nr:metallophosphoesterase [Sulfurospirillum arsenophilum]